MILTSLTALTGTPQQVVGPAIQRQIVHLHNQNKSSNNYIHFGNETVSTTNSPHLDPGESKILTLEPHDTLWAVSDPSGLELGVLIVRQSQ